MGWGLGSYVPKRHAMNILVDQLSGDFSADDPLKQCRHVGSNETEGSLSD